MADIVLDDAGWGSAFMVFIFAMIVLAIVLIAAAHRPVFFRMGLRNAARRPSQTSLVLVGLMIGTAILSGAFVAGDTMEFTIVKDVYETTDLLDETVDINGGPTYNYSVYETIANDPDIKRRTDGISPIFLVSGLTSVDVRSGQTEPSVYLHGIVPSLEKGFGKFKTVQGKTIDGSDLGENETIMNNRLADALLAKKDDVIQIYYLPPFPAAMPPGPGTGSNIAMATLTVNYIVEDSGKANFNGGKNLFMGLSSVQRLMNATGMITTVKLSNKGGVVDGANLSGKVINELEGIISGLGPEAGALPQQFAVNSVKEDAVEIAESSSASFSDFLVMASSFTVATGVLLIVNIFVMLAEERKRELGISRAVGMRRSYLVRGFLFEGLVYSIVAAFVGAFLGVVVGWALIGGIFSSVGAIFTDVPFYFKNSSILMAFSMGFLITVGTVALASWRVSKLNIVRAIRNIEEPIQKKGTKKGLAGGVVLLVLGVLFVLMSPFKGLIGLLGPSMFLFGLALIIRRWVRMEVAYTFGGLGVLLYSFYFMLYGTMTEDESMMSLVTVGLLMVFGAVLALVSNSRAVVKGVGRLLSFSPRSRAVAMPAVGHPLNKGFRTGMTISMFSLIIFIILLFSIFFAVFTPDLSKEGGGYDLRASTSVPVADIWNISFGVPGAGQVDYTTLNDKVSVIDGVAEYGFWGNFFKNGTEVPTYGPPYHSLIGIDANFSKNSKFEFAAIAKGYSSDAEVWSAVANDPSLAIVDSTTAGTYIPIVVGDELNLPATSGGNMSRKYKIIAVVDQVLFPGLFVQKDALMKDFPQVRGDNVFLIKVKAGESPGKVAKDLEADFRLIGMNVLVIKDVLEMVTEATKSIFQMFELFMSLGLVVGIASLGVLSVRAVIERKQEIGIMRAIGFRKSMVLRTFVLEMLFVTTMGIVIGVLIGYGAGWGIWKSGMEDLGVAFTVPWYRIGMTVLITYIAAVICTILPAYKASRTNPAEAIRVVE